MLFLYKLLDETLNAFIRAKIPDFYRPQTKLQKGYVFTSVCQEFCPQEGSVVHPLGRPPIGRHTPLGRHTQWADTPPVQTPPGQTHPQADGYCSGRYASYWNAFLLALWKKGGTQF